MEQSQLDLTKTGK